MNIGRVRDADKIEMTRSLIEAWEEDIFNYINAENEKNEKIEIEKNEYNATKILRNAARSLCLLKASVEILDKYKKLWGDEIFSDANDTLVLEGL